MPPDQKKLPVPPKKLESSLEVQVSRLNRLLTSAEDDIITVNAKAGEANSIVQAILHPTTAPQSPEQAMNVVKTKLPQVVECLIAIQQICSFYQTEET